MGGTQGKSIYSWKPGAHIHCDANVAGAVCEELSKSGELTPKNLVDVSEPSEAPLHNCFEWDDSVAAGKYREHQGAHIIRCLIVAVVKDNDEPDPEPKRVVVRKASEGDEDVNHVRAFVSVTMPGEKARPYEQIEVATNDAEKRARLMKCARRDLECFYTKYCKLLDITGTTNVFEQLKSGLETYEEQ